MPFHQQFEGGWQVDSPPQGKILFVGDSVMQQYVEPMALALGYEKSQIELATRGLCVMLKGWIMLIKSRVYPVMISATSFTHWTRIISMW